MPKQKKVTNRTTIFLDKVLDLNIEAYALTHGKTKTGVIQEAIFKFLTSEGMQPDKIPQVVISYKE